MAGPATVRVGEAAVWFITCRESQRIDLSVVNGGSHYGVTQCTLAEVLVVLKCI